MKKSDVYRLSRIIELGDLLERTLLEDEITAESLARNYKQQWLVSTPLYNIGEQAYCLSSEFKDAHPEIEWRGIAGLRHRLVHDYEGTNWNVIASVLFDELPLLIKRAKMIASEADTKAHPFE